MRDAKNDGYILASALGVLFATSIVAVALVGTSGEAAGRVRKAESSAALDAVLEAAVPVIASQLSLDPQSRTLDLSKDGAFEVMDQSISYRVRWETNKLDVNSASPAALERRLADARVEAALATQAIAAIQQVRERTHAIRLLSDLGVEASMEQCLAEYLTVFGGKQDWDPENMGDPIPTGRPADGSRLSLDLTIEGSETKGLRVVVLMTGNKTTPWKVLDWMRTGRSSSEECHEP